MKHKPFLLLALFALLIGCDTTRPTIDTQERPPQRHTLVLVSIDGFRHDYLDRADVDAPTLRRIAEEGVRAESLIPAFPTKTFPNHYTIATGLYPENHGIVGNTMFDPEFAAEGTDSTFSLGDRAAVSDGRWWEGEPIWVTAEKQGVSTGTLFWPGSEAEIAGYRPDHWLPFDGDMPYDARVDTVLTWLQRPSPPRFVTLYFEAVDTAGHRFGPDAPETAEAIGRVDAALARFIEGLRNSGRLDSTDIVVTSDHGMTAVSSDRTAPLDDVLTLDEHRILWGEPVGIWPTPGTDIDSLVTALDALNHVQTFRREDTPERLHYRNHQRIPPIVLIAEEGWTMTSSDHASNVGGGAHGFDNAYTSMHGIFLADGPSFPDGEQTGPINAVDVCNVLADVLGITPAENDGDPAVVGMVLE